VFLRVLRVKRLGSSLYSSHKGTEISSAIAAAPPIHHKPSSTGLEFILPTTGSLETFPEESHLKLESVTLKESQ
jgi:hypothetical protein